MLHVRAAFGKEGRPELRGQFRMDAKSVVGHSGHVIQAVECIRFNGTK